MEGDPATGTYEIPAEGLHIGYDEGVGPDETVLRLHRNREFIGNIRPHGPANERRFTSDVLRTPVCLNCQITVLLEEFDRRTQPTPTT